MSIFTQFAPLYWAAGIPAIPLKINSKAPILNEWTQYAIKMPTEAVQNHWLQSYAHNNIGLPFGPGSGLCAIDIDTEDQDKVDMIMDCLPASPWVRVGKKGCGLIFRFQGQSNFKLRDETGMLCEFLGHGNQMVLPPSIHPETMMPYTANTNLWEVMDKIQPLDPDIEQILNSKLQLKGLKTQRSTRSAPMVVVPAGERDIQLVKQAGYFARVVLGIDKSTRFTLAEAMEQMAQWVIGYTAGAAGDDMDPEKGVAKLLEFLLQDIEKGKTMPDGWDVGLSDVQLEHPTIVKLIDTQADQKWTLSRAMAFFEEQLSQNPEDRDWAQACTRLTIEQVASDSQFAKFEFDTVGSYLKTRLAKLGVHMTKPALTGLFKECRRGDAASLEDHHAVADFMIEHIRASGRLRYCNSHFGQWTGTHFARQSEGHICHLIGQVVHGNTLVRRHNDYVSVMKAMQNQLQEQVLEVPQAGINFSNGFLDRQGTLHPHDPCFGQTHTLAFAYEPDHQVPPERLLGALRGAWGEDADFDDKVAALQEIFGVTMFQDATTYQRAFLLYGVGASSKSVILDVLVGMLPPEAVTSLSPSVWGERFQTAQLVDIALNVCAELPELGKIQGDTFKQIVDGSIHNAEFKCKTGFPFSPRAAHVFASNHLPMTRDTSAAFIRRWLFLRFTRPIPENLRVPNYHEVILEERAAIAVWAVQGYLRLRDRGRYTLPDSHATTATKVLRSNNSVAAFLETSPLITTIEPAETCDAREAFMCYKRYMGTTSSGSAGSFEAFTGKMEDLGHAISYGLDPVGNPIQFLSGIEIVRTFELPALRQVA